MRSCIRTGRRWVVAICLALFLFLDGFFPVASTAGSGHGKSGPPVTADTESSSRRNTEVTSPGAATTVNANQPIPAYRQATNVAIITVHGEIDDITVRSIKRRIQEAQNRHADAIVFDIDTWGGQATSALEISNIIKSCPIQNTIAWVHPKAISAGTIISLACREIVMSPNSMIGDCAPILPGLIPIPTAERAKIESPILAEVVDSARRNGYDEQLVMSFVAVDMELWLVQNKQTGDRIFVNREEYKMLFGAEPPDTLRAAAGSTLPQPAQIHSRGSRHGHILPYMQNEQPLTMAQREKIVEQNQTLPSRRPKLTLADRGQWELVEPVIDNKTLLVLHNDQALDWGISQKTVANEQELESFLGAQQAFRLDQSWSEGLVQILCSTGVRAVLLIIVIIGVIWEMATPGVGVPLTIALLAGILLFGAPMLAGMAQWWDVALVLLGLILLAIEMFVLPGFGVTGIVGVICLAIGFIGTFVAPDPSGSFLPTTQMARANLLNGVLVLFLGLFVSGLAFWYAARHFHMLPGISRMVLTGQVGHGDHPAELAAGGGMMPGAGGGSGSMLEAMAPNRVHWPGRGDLGTAVTVLRPVGRARFESGIYDVVAKTGIVEEGAQVVVRTSDAFSIVVEKIVDDLA